MEKPKTLSENEIVEEIVRRVSEAKLKTPDMPYPALLLYHTGEVMSENHE